ncbi:MAG: hypothetical protein IJ357_03785 [Oscillospiraceae bacterium]|nr:hypothetical protein [Oscillospiraceae bacterium]
MKRQRIAALGLVLALLLLTGCIFPDFPTQPTETEAPETEPAPVYTYEKVYFAGLTEPMGHSLLLSSGAMETTANGHVYQFEPAISEEERVAFIQTQEALLSYLLEQGVDAGTVTCRVLSDYTCRSDSENGVAYFGLDALNTWEQALVTLQTLWGDYTNYGYLYALSNRIAGALGWAVKAGKAAPEVFEENPALLSLVYPCFISDDTTNQEIAACRAMAISVLDRMEDPYSGEADFLSIVADYALDEGINFSHTELGFAYNGSCSVVKIRTKYLEVSFNSDADLYTEGPLSYIIESYEAVDEELEWICSFLDYTPEKRIAVELCGAELSFEGDYTSGLYYDQDRSIQIYYPEAIPRLYLYDIVGQIGDDGLENWHTWALCDLVYIEQTYEEMCWYYENDSDWQEYIRSLIGKEFVDLEDFFSYYDAEAHLALPTSPKNELYNGYSYSFLGYFTMYYDVDTYVEVILHPRQCYSLTGKTLDTIINDWCSYIENEVEVDEDAIASGSGYET